MIIEKMAAAGTLESSDAQVVVEPSQNGIEFELDSSVSQQYSRQIKETVLATLDRLDIKDIKIKVIDHGALDCTLKARVECAVFRASNFQGALPWGGSIK